MVEDLNVGLRWWRDVLILRKTKQYFDGRQARVYWLLSLGKIRLDHLQAT